MSPAELGVGARPAVRFIHSADWQLGMTRHFLSAEAQARFSQARIAAIETLGRLARETGAGFLVVSGDVFETNQVGPQTVRRTLDALRTVPVPVFLLPGNHDPLDAGSIFRSPTFTAGKPDHVTVLDDTTPRAVPGVPGVEVLGAPWTSKRPLRDLVAAAVEGLVADPDHARVLVAHGATDDLIAFGNPAAIGVRDAETALGDGRIAYLALGDRHSTTRVGTSGRIWYAGAPEPTDYDETASGNALVVDLLADGSCAVTTRSTGTWHFVRPAFDLDGPRRLGDLVDFLDGLPVKAQTIVKLTLIGTISLSEDARLQDLLEHHRDLLGGLEQWERRTDLVVRPDDDDFDNIVLAGFAADALASLRATAALSGADADAARGALSLLVRLAGAAGGAAAAGGAR